MYFLWFLSILNFITTKVIIPFTTFKENFTTNYTPSIFMFHYFPNKIEASIKLGTPTQEILLRIKTFTAPISVNSVQMGTYQITRFNESNSSSFISLNDKPLYYGEYDFKSALKSKEILLKLWKNCLIWSKMIIMKIIMMIPLNIIIIMMILSIIYIN